MSEGTNHNSFASAGILMNVGTGLLVAALIMVFSPWINLYVGQTVATLLASLVVGDYTLKTAKQILQGEKQVSHSGVLTALERVGRTLAQIILTILGYGLFGLLFGHVVALFGAAGLGFAISSIRLTRPRFEYFESLLAYVRYAWLGIIDSRVFAWVDTLILALFVTDTLIGIYEVAWSLAAVFSIISGSIGTTLFPELSDLNEQDDYQQIRHFINESIAFTGIFSIPGLVGALLLGERVLALYGQTFAKGAGILILLIMTQLVSSYAGQFRNTLNALDRPDITFRINLMFIIANVGLNVVLIMLIGWTGAAVASVLSASLSLVAGYIAVGKLVEEVSLPVRVLAAEVGGSFVMAIGVVGLQQTVPKTTAATFLLVFFGAGLYGLSVSLFSIRIRTKVWKLVPIS